MRDLFKSRTVAFKALTDADQPGTFEAIVAVFGNVDGDNEIVVQGAFSKSLQANPNPPIVYSHDWMSVPIGQTLEARETDQGLYVKGRLFIADDEDHARAREVYAAMRGGALKEFSFGGRVTKETRNEDQDGKVTWDLLEIDLTEYGPCLKGMNPATQLLAIKSMVSDGVIDRDEARRALGVDIAKADGDDGASEEAAPPADNAAADQALAEAAAAAGLDGDASQSTNTAVAADAATGSTDWGTVLSAVRAGVLTVPEARERLGLTGTPPEPDTAAVEAGDAEAQATAAAHAAALVELEFDDAACVA